MQKGKLANADLDDTCLKKRKVKTTLQARKKSKKCTNISVEVFFGVFKPRQGF